MTPKSSHSRLPHGLLQLDATGLVLRYAPVLEPRAADFADGILGRNFFTDLVPTEEMKDFQPRFQRFMEHGQSTERLTITFASGKGPFAVQIFLARILEESKQGVESLALVRIVPREVPPVEDS